MAVYLVAYDLNKETTRPNIVAEVKRTAWAKLSESSYAIDTDETPGQILARLRQHLDSNDDCYVIALRKPWDGWGSKPVIEWLQERLV